MLHLAIGFAFLIWKIEFQRKKKKKSDKTLNKDKIEKKD